MSGKTVPVQHAVKEDACMVARERATTGIRTMLPRSKTDDEQSGIHFPERTDRSTVIIRMLGFDFRDKFRQTSAAPA